MHEGNRVYFGFFIVPLIFFCLIGCSDKTSKSASESQLDKESEVSGLVESLDTEEVVVDEENMIVLEGRTSGPMLPLYFDFDSTLIQGDQVERIENNADFLKENSSVRVRIEGNCDPRGTREYNLALGERRALSARKYLVNLGVEPERLSTISWGKEKLLLFGHDELSWAQNRRDDFIILN
jgi:peptidoglycan-associated lipoprotein